MCLCFGLGPAPQIFKKIIKDSHCDFETDSNQNNPLPGRHVADDSITDETISGLEIAMDTLIFLQKYVLVPLQKIEFLGLKIDSTRMTLTLPKEKVKATRIKCQTQMLFQTPITTLWEVISLVGSLCLTAQAVLPAILQIKFLQQQQIASLRNNPDYQS